MANAIINWVNGESIRNIENADAPYIENIRPANVEW